MCLILGAALMITGPSGPSPGGPGAAFSDDDAAAQVVTAARRVVSAAGLQRPTGGYAFMPCGPNDGPPYQAVLRMSFAVPQHDPAQYLDDVAAALVADGWVRSAAEGEHFGTKLTSPGLTALLTREPRRAESATLQLYGECRVGGDHSEDNPVWTEVTF